MILRLVITALIMMFTLTGISGCGNKGELYLIPDEINEKDLGVLDEALDEQTLDSTETEDLNNLSQEERDKLKTKKLDN